MIHFSKETIEKIDALQAQIDDLIDRGKAAEERLKELKEADISGLVNASKQAETAYMVALGTQELGETADVAGAKKARDTAAQALDKAKNQNAAINDKINSLNLIISDAQLVPRDLRRDIEKVKRADISDQIRSISSQYKTAMDQLQSLYDETYELIKSNYHHGERNPSVQLKLPVWHSIPEFTEARANKPAQGEKA